MTDVIVRATATRWASDDHPGWIDIEVIDANGQNHRVVEKVPVISSADEFTSSTAYPVELWVEATADEVMGDRVAIKFGSSVETVAGLSKLTVAAEDVRWL